jgi:rare lipoprotein A
MIKKIALALLFQLPLLAKEEVGIASWYGKENQISSTGKRLQHTQYCAAAHKKLPIGTKVMITNIKTHKTICAVIEDRGPYTKGRIIDLNYLAAKRLGIIQTGVAKVKIITLESVNL